MPGNVWLMYCKKCGLYTCCINKTIKKDKIIWMIAQNRFLSWCMQRKKVTYVYNYCIDVGLCYQSNKFHSSLYIVCTKLFFKRTSTNCKINCSVKIFLISVQTLIYKNFNMNFNLWFPYCRFRNVYATFQNCSF